MASAPPPLPPGFVPVQQAAPPPGRPALVPLGPRREPAPPSGYRATETGLAPIPGGPADPSRNAPPSGYREAPGGRLEPIPGGPADPSSRPPRTRQLPTAAIHTIEQGATSFRDLTRLTNTFDDNYTGFGSSIENWAQNQSYLPSAGTPGQSQWWSDLNATDNALRNALFGASLTAGEQQAWERTTVTPGMPAARIRENLARRQELARELLTRRARTYRAGGYNEDQIREALGEAVTLLDDPHDQTADDVRASVEHARAAPPPAADIGAPPPPGGGGPEDDGLVVDIWQGGPPPRNRSEANAIWLNNYERARSREPTLTWDAYIERNLPEAERRQAETSRALANPENNRGMDAIVNAANPWAGAVREGVSALFGQESGHAFQRGAIDTVSLGLHDEGSAAYNTLFGGGGTYDENLAAARSVIDDDSTNHPVSRFAGQAAGGLLLPAGSATTAGRLALVGAGYGGAYGFGSSNGSITDRLISAGNGALVGGAGAYALGGLANGAQALGRRALNARRTAAADLAAAAERQGIDLLPADVGGPMVRRLSGGMSQSTFGGAPIINRAEQAGRQFAGRVGELAATEGAPARQEVLGETVEGAFNRFNTNSQAEGRRMYGAAREQEGGQSYEGTQALAALDSHIGELSGNAATNAAEINGLNTLRRDLVTGNRPRPKSIDEMRDLRTSTRSQAQTDELRATGYQRRAGEVLDALSEDIASQMPPAAAAEFRRADNAWRERLDFIDDVETRLLGQRNDRSAEKVTRSLMEMTRGDSARFNRVLEQVTPEEAGIIRGSVITEMGRPPPGQPGEFSITTWARNYRALPERTRDALFRGGNREHAADLLTIADGLAGTERFRNFSNSAGAIGVTELLRTIASGVGGAAGGIPGAIGTAAGWTALERGLGQALASPRLVRLLARPPEERGRLIRRMGQIAAREPAIAPQIHAMQSFLEGGARSAAAEDTQDPR